MKDLNCTRSGEFQSKVLSSSEQFLPKSEATVHKDGKAGKRNKSEYRPESSPTISGPGSGLLLLSMLTVLLSALVFCAPQQSLPREDTLDVAIVNGSTLNSALSLTPTQSISEEKIRQSGALHLEEILKTLPSVNVKDYGGAGGLKTVSVRSFSSHHTAIIYDGILVSDAQNGQTDISQFSTNGVAAVNLYSSGLDNLLSPAKAASQASAIEIVTNLFQNRKTTVSSSISSFETLDARVFHSGKVSFSANFLKSRDNYPFSYSKDGVSYSGTRSNADISRATAELNCKLRNITFKLNALGSEQGLPGSIILYTSNPVQRLWTGNLLGNIGYTKALSEKLTLRASAGSYTLSNRFLDTSPLYPSPQTDTYLQQEFSAAAALMYSSGPLSLSFAADSYINTLRTSFAQGLRKRAVGFASARAKYTGGAVRVMGGLTLAQKYLLPQLSVSWRLPVEKDLHLRAFVKKSVRLPSLNDLWYQRIGNPSLRAEQAWQSGAGLTFQHGGLSITADPYLNYVKDKIVATPTMFIWRMRNLGKVIMAGTDLSMDLQRKHFWARLGYSYQYAVDVTDPGARNYLHQIAYTPRHSGSASAGIKTPWANLSYTLQCSSERYSLSENLPAYRMEPYADHSLCLSRSWKGWTLSVEGRNLTGKNYEIIKYYPMPGRSYRIQIQIEI